MAAGVRQVLIRFRGDPKPLGKASQDAQSRMQKFQATVSRASAGIVAAAAAAGAGLLKVGDDFDKAFDKIKVGTGATGKTLQGLQRDFKRALAGTASGMDVVADAVANLNTMTGASGKVLQRLTVQVTEASRLLGEDGAENSAAFGQTLQQWQIPAEKGTAVINDLFKVTQQYGLGLGEVTGQLNTYGSVLQNAGFTMRESATLFGMLNKAGLDVSRVMPGLNKAFRTWAEEGKDVQAELTKTVNKIANAEDGTKALKIATEAFGAEGAQRMTTAVRSGAISLEDLTGALGDTTGLINQTAQGTDSWREKLQRLRNKGLAAVEPVATAAFGALDRGTDILKSVSEWSQRNTGTVKTLAIALGGIAAAVLAVNVALKIYAGVQAVIRAATVAWTAVNWLLAASTWATLGPILLVIAAIAAIVVIVVLLIKHWDSVKKAFAAAWDFIWTYLRKFWDWLVMVFWERGIKFYFKLIAGIIGWLRDRWVAGFNKARSIAGNVLDFVTNIPGRIRSAFAKIAGFVSAPFRAGFNAVRRFWNSTIGGKGFSIPSWVPGVGGKEFRLPRFHAGGVVPGPLGEEVPILARAGERVLTREQQLDGPRVIENHIHIGDEVVRVVRTEITGWARGVRRRAMAGAGAVR